MQSNKIFVYLVGLHIYYKMIHGPYNIKLITAQQAKIIHMYENIKMKLCKCIAAIWFNKTLFILLDCIYITVIWLSHILLFYFCLWSMCQIILNSPKAFKKLQTEVPWITLRTHWKFQRYTFELNGVHPVVFVYHSQKEMSVARNYSYLFCYSYMFRSFSTIIGLPKQYGKVRLKMRDKNMNSMITHNFTKTKLRYKIV